MIEARAAAGQVEALLAENPRAAATLVGALNAGYRSPELQLLREAGLWNALDRVPSGTRYTMIDNGLSLAADHILATPALHARLVRTHVLHGFSDFPPPLSDDLLPFGAAERDPVIAVYRME
jgi:predicted extracellular nuclease